MPAGTVFETQLDEIFDNAGVGIAQLDTSGRYVMVNDHYCNMVGCTRDELVHAPLQDFVHPDDLPVSIDAFVRVMELGSPLVIDQRHLRDDGTFVWISNNVSAGRNSRGDVQYVLAISHDVTARKEAEQTLNRAQANLRLVLDAAADGLYCVDRDCKVTLCNAAFLRMLGFSRESDAIGRDLDEVIRYARANRPRFRDDVVREHIHSYPYPGQVVVGAELPGAMTYYDVPPEYGVTEYRYTVVNDTPVLVDPRTHRIVEVIG